VKALLCDFYAENSPAFSVLNILVNAKILNVVFSFYGRFNNDVQVSRYHSIIRVFLLIVKRQKS
jgi:hypothetical protein